MQRVLRKSSPASNNQIPQASLPVRAGALFSCRLSSFWQSAGLQNHRPLVRIRPHENSNLLQTENRQRISTLTVFLWARVDSNNHGFVPPKPLDFKKLGIMQIFGHPKWNTRTFRPGRNVKSGLQSGLFLGVRGVLSQHSGDGLRSGNITTCDIMCVPAEGIHAAAVADHSAQLSG